MRRIDPLQFTGDFQTAADRCRCSDQNALRLRHRVALAHRLWILASRSFGRGKQLPVPHYQRRGRTSDTGEESISTSSLTYFATMEPGASPLENHR